MRKVKLSLYVVFMLWIVYARRLRRLRPRRSLSSAGELVSLGADEGLELGAALGLGLGDELGALLGDALGALEGLSVVLSVGVADGAEESSTTEGLMEGASESSIAVGLAEGASDP